VYDGDDVTVTGTEREGGLDLALHDPAGELCASGRAELAEVEPVTVDAYGAAPLPAAVAAPDFALGEVLGTLAVPAMELPDHAWPARLANAVLTANVALPPWMHVESRTRHLAPATAGQPVTVRAFVAGLWERRGHRFVDLDVLVLDGSGRPLAQLRHIAIYELAQLRG
jgi:hypothetical protein